MLLRDGDLVLGHLAERFDEVDDGVAVQVAGACEDAIDGHDDALRAGRKYVSIKEQWGQCCTNGLFSL